MSTEIICSETSKLLNSPPPPQKKNKQKNNVFLFHRGRSLFISWERGVGRGGGGDGEYYDKLLIFCWTEWNAGMEPTLGLSLATNMCNQRPVTTHLKKQQQQQKTNKQKKKIINKKKNPTGQLFFHEESINQILKP